MRTLVPLGVVALLAGAGADPPAAPGLLDPIPLTADGKPVTLSGSLYPLVADLGGKGRPDLLLGTQDKGRMLLARNTGGMAFGPPKWFDELNPGVTIPAG